MSGVGVVALAFEAEFLVHYELVVGVYRVVELFLLEELDAGGADSRSAKHASRMPRKRALCAMDRRRWACRA